MLNDRTIQNCKNADGSSRGPYNLPDNLKMGERRNGYDLIFLQVRVDVKIPLQNYNCSSSEDTIVIRIKELLSLWNGFK